LSTHTNIQALQINNHTFSPAWWLTGPHLQTIYPSLFRNREDLPLEKERLELPDGDFLDLAWMPEQSGDLCLVMHGLEGSLYSHYSRGLIKAAHNAGKHIVFMHFRGCSGEPNRLPRRYHSGETGDLRFLLETLKARFPAKRAHVVAVSLGGNMLLKYLGEYNHETLIESTVVISVPFDLAVSGETLNRGFATYYQRHLLNSLQSTFYEKAALMEMFMRIPGRHEINTIRDFDDLVTAPLHGFRGAADYYARCSSRQFTTGIKTPTLMIHAIDDPFMTPGVIPGEGELPSAVSLELSRQGGHVGFIQGQIPLLAEYWLDRRVREFLGS
jgi:predicted alpha/beta-fold hydrolase